MSVAMKASRTQVWLENLGDWSWPGQGGAAVEFLPPSWVPAFPPRREAAVAGRSARGMAARPRAGAQAPHRRAARRPRGGLASLSHRAGS